MSTDKESAPWIFASEMSTLNSYYWACARKYLLKNYAIDLSATEINTNN